MHTLLFQRIIGESLFDEVKEMFLQAEIYVYEKDCVVQGFIGLNKEYIEGIFVSKGCTVKRNWKRFTELCERAK